MHADQLKTSGCMQVATNAIIIVILDTCRYNPQNDTWADREKGVGECARACGKHTD